MDLEVGGSIPLSHPKFSNDLADFLSVGLRHNWLIRSRRQLVKRLDFDLLLSELYRLNVVPLADNGADAYEEQSVEKGQSDPIQPHQILATG